MLYLFCTCLAILAEQQENPAVLRSFLRVRYYPTELADTQYVLMQLELIKILINLDWINQNFD